MNTGWHSGVVPSCVHKILVQLRQNAILCTIISGRNSRCGKVMFSQFTGVCHPVQGVGGVGIWYQGPFLGGGGLGIHGGIAVVDPGFPRGGGANFPGGANIRFCQKFPKTA